MEYQSNGIIDSSLNNKRRGEVLLYQTAGARGALVGEALMKSKCVTSFIQELLGEKSILELPVDQRIIKKVCGITNIEDAIICLENGADMIGLIFCKSPRQISIQAAKAIVTTLREYYATQSSVTKNCQLKIVGVFSNSTPYEMNRVAWFVGLDYLQLHGDEDSSISTLLCRPSIKVFHVMENQVNVLFQNLRENIRCWDLILLDTCTQKIGQQGGSGITFDWSIGKEIAEKFKVKLMIAGGISGENLNEVIEIIGSDHIYGVDTCSGVEGSVKGKKDRIKLLHYLRG